jgi:hypothetical protein
MVTGRLVREPSSSLERGTLRQNNLSPHFKIFIVAFLLAFLSAMPFAQYLHCSLEDISSAFSV